MARRKKQKTEYRFRDGARVVGVTPEAAAGELDRIRTDRGDLTPRAVVDESRPEDAPLHPAFEWDDAKAADEYRLGQARSIIRAVIEVPEGESPRPVYCHVTTADGGSYQPTAVVVRSDDLYAAALAELRGCVKSAQRALDELIRAAEGRDSPPDANLATLRDSLATAGQAADAITSGASA